MGDKKTAANSALNAGDSGDFGDGAPNATTLAFGPFEVDLALRTLRRDGAPVTLGARPFALLEILLRHAPAPVAHNVVRRHVWPGTHVADNNLRVQLWHLRQALGDDASRPQYVETLVGVGYRFVAPVRRGAMDAPDDRAAVHAAPIDPARRGWLRVAAMGLIGLAAGGAGTAWLLRGDDEPAIDLPRAIAYERSPGYGAYVRARRAWTQRSRDGLAAAMADYRRALARDPRFAPAMAGLAEAHLHIAISHVGADPPRAAFVAAAAWARRALRRDDTLAVAHSVLGHASFLAAHDLPRADNHYRRAASLAPEQAQPWQRYGWFLLTTDRTRAAEKAFRRALAVDRLDANANAALGLFYYCVRAHDAAARQLELTRQIHPDFGLLWIEIARLRDVRGDHAGAIDALARAREVLGAESEIVAAQAYNLARLGRSDAARARQAQLARPGSYVSRYHVAVSALGLDDLARGQRALMEAWHDRSLWLPWLRFDHRLAPLRARGLLDGLLRTLDLPPARTVG